MLSKYLTNLLKSTAPSTRRCITVQPPPDMSHGKMCAMNGPGKTNNN